MTCQRLLPLLAFLLPTLLSAQLTRSPWEWQNPLPTGSILERVAVGGGDVVVAAGYNGAILLSNDRGATWSEYTLGSSAIWYGLDMMPDVSGLIVGEAGRILRTTDNGATWRLERSATGETLGAVALLDTLRAVAVGSRSGGGSVAIRTTDGGASWSAATLPGATSALLDLEYVGSNDAWACGVGGTLIATTDGGASWSDVALPTSTTLRGIGFANERRGAVVGEGGVIFKTDDGGAGWEAVSSVNGTDLLDVTWIDSLRAVMVGVSNSLETTDGGETWHFGGPGADYRSVDVRKDFVIAVGAGGRVSFRTDTAGWVVGSRHVMTNDLRAVEAFDRDRLVVVGGGYAATTSDGGRTWKNAHMGLPKSVTSVALGKEGFVVGVGSAGGTARSFDFGATWEPVPNGAKRDLRDVDLVDGRHGVAVGPGTILTTHDGGASWRLDTTTVTQILYSCDMLDSATGFLAGTYGLVMRTTDGGESWEKILTETSEFIVAIDFLTRDSGWFMTRYERFATTDGGATWSRTPGPGTEHLMLGACFFDLQRGWIATQGPNYSNDVWRTTDGGREWRRVPHNITALVAGLTELTGIRFLDDTTGWVVGGDGTVLRYRGMVDTSSAVSIHDLHMNSSLQHHLYPNPTYGLVTVRLAGGNRIVSLTLSDAAGRSVDALSLTEGVELPASSVAFATQGMARGVYYLRVVSEREGTTVMPIVVE